MRQILLDTETTGLRIEDGHRIIEIACVEMLNRRLTGDYFHMYLNPEREIDAGAVAVHGITNDSLKDKPLFASIAQKFIDYVRGAELIIHNAPFDLSFINYELQLVGTHWKPVTEYCSVVDTLVLARQLHVGQRNSLDALCKRYGVDNSKRDLHGALLDANLLAQVYLAMTGGQGSFFDGAMANTHNQPTVSNQFKVHNLSSQHDLPVLKADTDELSQHEDYLAMLRKQGKCLWDD